MPVIVSRVATTGMARPPGKAAKPSVETEEMLARKAASSVGSPEPVQDEGEAEADDAP